MEKKICNKCKIEKDVCEYHKAKKHKDGLSYQCKICVNSLRKQNYYKNIDREHLRNNTKNSKKHSKEYSKKWRENNREKLNQYYRNRYHSDPTNKIIHNLCARLNKYIKLNKLTKNNKSIEYIGCTPFELRTYIESQFTDGMSWDNYGVYGWHIDRIIPKSSIKTEEDLIKISHYSNLRPLWAFDNLSKGNKTL
jgi:hypothetical protein